MKQVRKKTQKYQGIALESNHNESWVQSMLYGAPVIGSDDSTTDTKVRRRLLVMSAAMIVVLTLFILRLFMMQVLSASSYEALANGNRVREEVTYAPRGKILDARGEILAENTLIFQLTAIPYLLENDERLRLADAELIGTILNQKPQKILDTVLAEGDEFVQPLLVAENISHKKALALEAHSKDLKGYTLEEIPVRSYNNDAALAHIIGYSGRVSETDLEASTNDQLLPTDFIGKVGIEKTYDERLRGQNGVRKIEVDALGRPVRVIASKEPIAGEDIRLSIDLAAQKSMYASMQKQMKKAKSTRSAGVAVNPKTGEVIAMVSIPSYDNNLFARGISQSNYTKLIQDAKEPLYNKVIAGGYTSGSIIKPLVASAALQEKIVDENTVIVDRGYIDVQGEYGGSFRFRGWRPGGLGPMNVRSALGWSSNIYFYTVGGGHDGIEGLGEERLTKYYRMYGLGDQTGIDLPDETFGRVPDNEWKLKNKGEPWYVGDSYNISIGQGDLLISPLQITLAEAAIANNGYLLQPTLVSRQDRVVKREISVEKAYLQMVREGMRQVLTGGTTCECTFKDVPVVVAGKSGTAETNTPGGRPPHAWFTAFAPYENPEFLATVLIEEGSGGSQFAAPVIADTMKTYFQSR